MTLTLKKMSTVVAVIAVSLLAASIIFLGNQRLAQAAQPSCQLGPDFAQCIVCFVFSKIDGKGPPVNIFPDQCHNAPGETPQCSDGIDNDSDGLIDAADPGCHTDGNPSNTHSYDPNDNSEFNLPQCSDGLDNDSDGLIDSADPACHTDGNSANAGSYDQTLDNESLFVPQCKDGLDNDDDGLVDSADPGCHTDFNAGNSGSYTPNGNDESAHSGGGGGGSENTLALCSDGIDNNGNGLIDLADPSCAAFIPHLTIVKNAIGGNSTFNFTLSGATATTTGITTSGGVGTSTVINLSLGSTTVSENVQTAWDFTSSNCVYGGDSVGVALVGGHEISVDAGDNVTCTFTNTKQSGGGGGDGGTTSLLSLTKGVSNGTPNPGDTVTYTLTLKNNGPATATGVSVTDLLPSGLTYISDDSSTTGSTYATSTGIWTIGSLADGLSAILHIMETVNSGTGGEHITNIATSTASNDDPSSTNTNSVVITPNTPGGGGGGTATSSDISLTKGVNTGTPNIGDTVTYTITATNEGPAAASGVSVTDVLPAGLTFVSDDSSTTGTTYATSTGMWTIGSLADASSTVLHIMATVNSGTGGEQITNTATSSATNGAPNANNTSSVSITPNTPGGGGGGGGAATTTGALVVKKVFATGTTTPSLFSFTLNGAATTTFAASGENDLTVATGTYTVLETATSTYTASYNNCGAITVLAGATTTCTITNTLAATSSTMGSLVIKKVFATGTTTPTLFSFSLNGAATTTFDADGRNDLLVATGTYSIAEVATSTYTPAYDNCSGLLISAGTTTTCTITNTLSTTTADLSLTKNVDKTSPNPGDTIVFTLTVTNNGPNTAPGVVVTDLLPGGLSYVSDDATTTGSTYATSTGAWAIGTLANGSSTALHITASVASGTGGQTITNTASATSGFTDPNTGNDSASKDITPPAPASTGGGGGNGGSGGNGGGGNGPPVGLIGGGGGGGNTVPLVALPNNGGGVGGGTVLGASTSNLPGSCSAYLTSFIRFGANNDTAQVDKLQAFLIGFEGAHITMTGVYDQPTLAAVEAFQAKYASDILAPWGISSPTGYVYLTTRKKINEIYCGSTSQFSLTTDEQQIINQSRSPQPGASGGPTSSSGLPASSTAGPVPSVISSTTSTSSSLGGEIATTARIVGSSGSNPWVWVVLLGLAVLGAGYFFWPRPPTVIAVSPNMPMKIPPERVQPKNTT